MSTVRIRPWNRPGVPFASVECDAATDCPFCKAGRELCQWPRNRKSVHFLESEDGALHRLEGDNTDGRIVVMSCSPVTERAARREIAQAEKAVN